MREADYAYTIQYFVLIVKIYALLLFLFLLYATSMYTRQPKEYVINVTNIEN